MLCESCSRGDFANCEMQVGPYICGPATPQPTPEERALTIISSLLGQAEQERPSRFAPWRECDVVRLSAPVAAAIREAEVAAEERGRAAERERAARVAVTCQIAGLDERGDLDIHNAVCKIIAARIREGEPPR